MATNRKEQTGGISRKLPFLGKVWLRFFATKLYRITKSTFYEARCKRPKVAYLNLMEGNEFRNTLLKLNYTPNFF